MIRGLEGLTSEIRLKDLNIYHFLSCGCGQTEDPSTGICGVITSDPRALQARGCWLSERKGVGKVGVWCHSQPAGHLSAHTHGAPTFI